MVVVTVSVRVCVSTATTSRSNSKHGICIYLLLRMNVVDPISRLYKHLDPCAFRIDDDVVVSVRIASGNTSCDRMYP